MTTAPATALTTRESTDEQPAPIVPTTPPVAPDGSAQLIVLPSPDGKTAPAWGLVKRTARGDVLAIKAAIPLSAPLGHFVKIPGTKGLSITIDGYLYLNKAMGVSKIVPERIFGDDGREHPNPYREVDAAGNLLRFVYRVGGWGRNDAGNYVLQWATIHYEVQAYMANELYETWAPKKWANKKYDGRHPGKDWGVACSTENVTEADRTNPTKKCVPLPGGITLVCDLGQPEAQELLIGRFSKLMKFAQRIAESIGWERVLRAFAGARRVHLSEADEKAGKSPVVNVTAWVTPDAGNVNDIEELSRAVDAGRTDVNVPGARVQYDNVQVDGSDDGDRAFVSAAVADEPETTSAPQVPVSPPAKAKTPAPPAPPADTPEAWARRLKIADLCLKVGDDIAQDILGHVGIEGTKELRHVVTIGVLDDAIALFEEELGKPKAAVPVGTKQTKEKR